jgi:hypothetical protein
MTVCVGAFAAESKAIVMVADKAITYSSNGPALMQWDTCVKKIIPIGPFGWRALIAGDPNFAQEVVRITVEVLTTQPDDARSPWKVMERMKLAYQQLRETRLTDTLLIPKLLTKDLLVARHKDYAPLDQSLIDDTTDEIAAFQINCHMLVCGFDDLGDPHMFLIADPGIAQNYDAIGFHATGIGADVALGRLLWDEVSPKDDLEKVLYHADGVGCFSKRAVSDRRETLNRSVVARTVTQRGCGREILHALGLWLCLQECRIYVNKILCRAAQVTFVPSISNI